MTAAKKTTQSRRIKDREALERDYRATNLTLRELAEKHGTSHSAIANLVKRHGWQRDLTDAVKLATKAKLIEQAVHARVHESVTTAVRDVTNVVTLQAEINAAITNRHRSLITIALRNQAEADAKLAEVRESVDNIKDAKLLVDATSVSNASVGRLIDLERKLYGLDDQDDKGSNATYEDMLLEVSRSRGSA